MKKRIFAALLTACLFCFGSENLFQNGDLKKTLNFIPLAKQVIEKGFQVATPWPAGFLVDTGSQPGQISYEGGEAPRIVIQSPANKETTVYTVQNFKPGTYKLRFAATGLLEKSYIKVRIYRYTKEKKWLEGTVLHVIQLDNARPNHVLDFTENKPEEDYFAIAFSCNGKVAFGSLNLTM